VQEGERLSLREAADALGVSEVTARRWIKSGKLKAQQPGRKYLIPKSAVVELLESGSPKKVQAPLWHEEDPKRRGSVVFSPPYEPRVTTELLGDYGIEANNSEIIVLNQYLHAHEHPPTGPYAIGHVKKEGEPVDHERVLTMLAYVLASDMLTKNETETARDTLHRELAGAR
jgi:excisionase family DNA binding protein